MLNYSGSEASNLVKSNLPKNQQKINLITSKITIPKASEIKIILANNNKTHSTPGNNVRNYGLDLLRIISMLSIITTHILVHGKLIVEAPTNTLKYNVIWFIFSLNLFPVNSFALISGIVGYTKYRYSNLLYLWFCVLFYSILITAGFKIFQPNLVSNIALLSSFFPVISQQYWFFSSFFASYLFMPILTKATSNISRTSFLSIVIIFLFFYSFLQIFSYGKDPFQLENGYSGIWLIILFVVGAYLGKFIINPAKKKKIRFYFFYFLTFLFSAIFGCLFKLKYKKSFINEKILQYNSPIILLEAISIIMIFSHLYIKNQYLIKVISFFTPLTFNVYLIHDNKLIRDNIITKYLFILNKYNEKKLFLSILFCAICIYIICSFIDFIRYSIFKLLKIRALCIFIVEVISKLMKFVNDFF